MKKRVTNLHYLIHNMHEKIWYFILILTDKKSSYLSVTLPFYTIFTLTYDNFSQLSSKNGGVPLYSHIKSNTFGISIFLRTEDCELGGGSYKYGHVIFT
jgi:hypothetical protein